MSWHLYVLMSSSTEFQHSSNICIVHEEHLKYISIPILYLVGSFDKYSVWFFGNHHHRQSPRKREWTFNSITCYKCSTYKKKTKKKNQESDMPSQTCFEAAFDSRSHYSDSAANNNNYYHAGSLRNHHRGDDQLVKSHSNYGSLRGSLLKSNQSLCSCNAETEVSRDLHSGVFFC